MTLNELTEIMDEHKRYCAPGSECGVWQDYVEDCRQVLRKSPWGDYDKALPVDFAEYWIEKSKEECGTLVDPHEWYYRYTEGDINDEMVQYILALAGPVGLSRKEIRGEIIDAVMSAFDMGEQEGNEELGEINPKAFINSALAALDVAEEGRGQA